MLSIMRLLQIALWARCAAAIAGLTPPTTKFIAGVPVYNYEMAFSEATKGKQSAATKDGLEWVVVFKQSGYGEQMQAFCSDAKDACTGQGNPFEGGLAFVTFEGTEQELEEFAKNHALTMEFIEPSLPVRLPPHEIVVAKETHALNTFGSWNKSLEGLAKKGMDIVEDFAFTEITQRPSGYYVIGAVSVDSQAIGWGPFSTFNQANQEFAKHEEYYLALVITSVDEYNPQKCRFSMCVWPKLQQWWDCTKFMGELCNGDQPTRRRRGTPSPTPTRRRVPPSPSPSPSPSPTPSPSPKTSLWGLDRIDDRSGTDGTYGVPGLDGTGVHVYVIDTGINTKHVDFTGRAIPTIDTSTGKMQVCDPTDTSCAMDKHGHGSHCAGTVAGVQSGVAKNVFVHAAKVMESTAGFTSRIVRAVDWIARHHEKPAVISMSLGADVISNAMNYSISMAAAAGVVSVVAGGNDNADACKQTPAHVPIAFTVGATSKADGRSRYSNYGSCTDIWAPGDRILSCLHNSDTRYQYMSGTSMATPHVAGAAALLLQVNPGLTPLDTMRVLQEYATKDAIANVGTGSPNFLLYVTQYTTTTTTIAAPSRRRRRRRRTSTRRRRRSKRRRRRRRSKSRRRRHSKPTPSRRRRRRRRRSSDEIDVGLPMG